MNGYFLRTVKGVRVKLRNPNLKETGTKRPSIAMAAVKVAENNGVLKSAMKK